MDGWIYYVSGGRIFVVKDKYSWPEIYYEHPMELVFSQAKEISAEVADLMGWPL